MPVRSLHHVCFRTPELTNTQKFIEDFGLVIVEQTDDHLVARTSGTDAWCYRAERGEAGFIGLGFLVDDESDLHNAVANHGATELRPLTTPGGGVGVTLTTPDGLKVDLVHGIEGDAPAEVRPELRINTPQNRVRFAEPQSSRTLGPAVLYRLGHLGLYVQDQRANAVWFEEVLGLKVSDSMHVPGVPQHTLVSFMRIDRGPDYVDHHSVFLAESEKADLHHISFEAQDYEAQIVAHRWLASQGWESNWGVGRHPLGSHVFDVWFGPDRYRFETFSDTDLLNHDHVTGHYDISKQELDKWVERAPDSYFD